MRTYKCPRCGEMSIPLMDKYRAGIWATISCRNCGARLCAFPLLLALMYLAYTWDVIWFIGMYHFTGNWMHFIYMVLVWIVLDIININLIPLAAMKPKKT